MHVVPNGEAEEGVLTSSSTYITLVMMIIIRYTRCPLVRTHLTIFLWKVYRRKFTYYFTFKMPMRRAQSVKWTGFVGRWSSARNGLINFFNPNQTDLNLIRKRPIRMWRMNYSYCEQTHTTHSWLIENAEMQSV